MHEGGRQGAVLDAEVRFIEHALHPWEVLTREQLAQRVHADQWHGPRFDRVLRVAADRGVVELLAPEFVALPTSAARADVAPSLPGPELSAT